MNENARRKQFLALQKEAADIDKEFHGRHGEMPPDKRERWEACIREANKFRSRRSDWRATTIVILIVLIPALIGILASHPDSDRAAKNQQERAQEQAARPATPAATRDDGDTTHFIYSDGTEVQINKYTGEIVYNDHDASLPGGMHGR